MITTIRKSFKSKAYKIILWITILAMAGVFSLPQLFKLGSRASWMVRINKTYVAQQEYMRKVAVYQEFIAGLRAQYGQYADTLMQSLGMDIDPQVAAYNEMIQEELINQAAQKMGMKISPEYRTEKLANPLFVTQDLFGLVPPGALDQHGGLNTALLGLYLQRMGLSMSQFNQKVSQVIARNLIGDFVKLAAYVPAYEIKNAYVARFLKKKYSALILPFDPIIQKERQTPIDESELLSYYQAQNAQSQRYQISEKRNAVIWRVKAADYGIVVNKDDVATYYEENKQKKYQLEPSKIQIRQIIFNVPSPADRAAVEEKAGKVHQTLVENKESFAKIAQEQSDDKESSKKGGLIEPFARGQKERAIDRAAFTLKEDGAISPVIEIEQGFAIIQRVHKKEPTYKTLDQVQQEIAQEIKEKKFKEILTKDMQQFTAEPTGQKKLADFLKDKGATSTSVDEVSPRNKEWGTQLFSMTQEGQVQYFVEKDKATIIQLTKISPSYMPSFEAIRDTVANDIYEERAAAAMREKLQQAVEKAKQRPLREVQLAFGGDFEKTDWISPDDNDALTALRKKNIPVESMLQLETLGAVATHFEGREGVIMKLDEIEPFEQGAFDAKKSELTKELENQETRLYLAGFVASLYRNATIEKNEKLGVLTEDFDQFYEE